MLRKVANVKQISTSLAGGGKCRVSVVIGQAGSGTGAELYEDKANAAKASVSGLGVVLGLISKAKVHQCIAWVKRIPHRHKPAGVRRRQAAARHGQSPGRAAGHGALSVLCDPAGAGGSYMNDSHIWTRPRATTPASRYAHYGLRGHAEFVPTYIPELGGNVYVDADTDKLASYTVAHPTCRPRAGGYGKGRGTERLQSRDRPRPGRNRQQHG